MRAPEPSRCGRPPHADQRATPGGARPPVGARCATTAACATVLLAGCAPTVPVEPAPGAADPRCAEIVLALPEQVGEGLERLRTSSQATTAWGDATEPLVLRCGVEPPGPTTDRCVTVDDGRSSVDWVVVPGEAQDDGSAPWTITTYGRTPAVELRVPASLTGSTSFLVDLGPAVSRAESTRVCL